jgi:hypothetical protein
MDGADIELFRDTANQATPTDWSLIDSQGGRWNFHGCAVAGPLLGKCLQALPALKDFWFDWRNYHPNTTVYQH